MQQPNSTPLQAPPHFAQKLLAWFDEYGRKDLPWQQNKTAYRVWVSEIMLQQTQVSTVIDYYLRFMASFPDVGSLAGAHEDAVLEHWAGLGYYARARNLHKTAKLVTEEYAGEFPDQVEALCELPGIGRSTAGAITSIAFGKQASILDGNVKRVLSRIAGVTSWPGERKTELSLWSLSDALTPDARTGDYTQAIMDLGATLCTRSKPDCRRCPMSQDCAAHQQGMQSEIPASKPKKSQPTKQVWMPILEHPKGGILLQKRPPTGIWGGLYSLPEFDFSLDKETLAAHIKNELGLRILDFHALKPFTHTFSHYKLEINPLRCQVNDLQLSIQEDNRYAWCTNDKLLQLGLPAPIKKILLDPDKQTELALE